MPSAREMTATVVTKGVLNSVRSASFRFLTDASGHRWFGPPISSCETGASSRSAQCLTVALQPRRRLSVAILLGYAPTTCGRGPRQYGRRRGRVSASTRSGALPPGLSTTMTERASSIRLSPADALAQLPGPIGERFVGVFRHGSLEV